MNLQKTPGTPADTGGGKITSKQSAKNSAPAKALQTQVKPPAFTAPRTIASLVTSAGMPQDRLSASIISFARFFSLPIKPELMAEIRRRAFTQQTKPQADSAKPAVAGKTREVFSLAAAAAQSKGVELQEKALKAYVKAIDPDQTKDEDSDVAADMEGEESNSKGEGKNPSEEKQNRQNKNTPAGIKKLTLESIKDNSLLDILNRLPEKNGRRWIVLPFEFSEDERQFRVSIRILLETTACGKMVLDITETGNPDENRGELSRLFVFDGPDKLTVYLKPEEFPVESHSLITGELSRSLGIPAGDIIIKTREVPFPFESRSEEYLFRSVDEVV